jgi:predicted AAA+ superfamily ATPase
VKSGEGPVGQVYAEIAEAEAKRRGEAREAQETKQAEALFELGNLADESEEKYSAAVYFAYIVNNLPAAKQAAEARTRLETIQKTNPEIIAVLRSVLGGG